MISDRSCVKSVNHAHDPLALAVWFHGVILGRRSPWLHGSITTASNVPKETIVVEGA